MQTAARAINFSAGPSALPLSVLEQAQSELLNWRGCGASVMEISHRSPEFMELRTECLERFRRLLTIPEHYEILFLQGGARLQFSMLPMNLLGQATEATYLMSGYWSTLAATEAERHCQVNRIPVVAESDQHKVLLPESEWCNQLVGAYLHYTPNETINGIRVPRPSCRLPLVADMSSCLLSEPIPVDQYSVIYACAQKNIGPPGLAYVILDKNCLQETSSAIPSYMDYQLQLKKDSLLNTPTSFSFYMTNLVLSWIEEQGGLKGMQVKNKEKAEALYDYIDQSDYYHNDITADCRSIMNVPFTLSHHKDEAFLHAAKEANIIGIKGHREVGGMRASLYNAVSLQDVMYLINVMEGFAKKQR